MASGSFWILPSVVSRWSSRFTLPGDVRELQHGDGDVADGDGRVELFSFANAGDEVGEVGVGHGVAADEVGGGGLLLPLRLNSPVFLPLRS